MAVIATPRTYNKKFAFRVEIDGFPFAGFRKCSGLEAEIAVVKQYEGGALTPQKSLGRVDFKDITLERGATRTDISMYQWFIQAVNAPANTGLGDQLVKRHADIVQLDRTGLEIARWTIVNALPIGFTAGDWDNDADENVIEKLVLSYDFFVKTL